MRIKSRKNCEIRKRFFASILVFIMVFSSGLNPMFVSAESHFTENEHNSSALSALGLSDVEPSSYGIQPYSDDPFVFSLSTSDTSLSSGDLFYITISLDEIPSDIDYWYGAMFHLHFDEAIFEGHTILPPPLPAQSAVAFHPDYVAYLMSDPWWAEVPTITQPLFNTGTMNIGLEAPFDWSGMYLVDKTYTGPIFVVRFRVLPSVVDVSSAFTLTIPTISQHPTRTGIGLPVSVGDTSNDADAAVAEIDAHSFAAVTTPWNTDTATTIADALASVQTQVDDVLSSLPATAIASWQAAPSPTVTGLAFTNYVFTVTVTGTDTSTANTTIEVSVEFLPPNLAFTHQAAFNIPASTVDTAIASIDVAPGAAGGTTPYTFSATGLPAGLSISAEGIISGTPTAPGAAGSATITVTDSATPTATDSIIITFGVISPAPVATIALLESLVVSSHDIAPIFNSQNFIYALNANYDVSNMTIVATPQYPADNVAIRYNLFGNFNVDAVNGEIVLRGPGQLTVIEVVVSGQGLESSTYTILVQRMFEPPPPRLSELTVSSANIANFNSHIFSYPLSVNYYVEYLTIHAISEHLSDSVVIMHGAIGNVVSIAEYGVVGLQQPGELTIVEITVRPGMTQVVYTIFIHRAPAPQPEQAELYSLEINPYGEIGFNGGRSYALSVEHYVSELLVTAVAQYPADSLTIRYGQVGSVTAEAVSGVVSLPAPGNFVIIEVEVSGQNMVSSIYTVVVLRAPEIEDFAGLSSLEIHPYGEIDFNGRTSYSLSICHSVYEVVVTEVLHPGASIAIRHGIAGNLTDADSSTIPLPSPGNMIIIEIEVTHPDMPGTIYTIIVLRRDESEPRIGDLNMDGRLTSFDAVLLAMLLVLCECEHPISVESCRCYNQLPVPIDMRAADIDRNGIISPRDLLLLQQHLAGHTEVSHYFE